MNQKTKDVRNKYPRSCRVLEGLPWWKEPEVLGDGSSRIWDSNRFLETEIKTPPVAGRDPWPFIL